MLQHVSAITFGRLQDAFFITISLCFNLEIPHIQIIVLMIKFTVLKISVIVKIQSGYS